MSEVVEREPTQAQRAIAEHLRVVAEKAEALAESVLAGRCHPSYFEEKTAQIKQRIGMAAWVVEDTPEGRENV